MKHLSVLVLLACVVFILVIGAPSGGKEAIGNAMESSAASEACPETARVYPIAPGVWYPTDGPLPEHPVRYYRVRCWPGCHRGSDYGKYPDQKLNMRPIFPTSTIRSESDHKGGIQ